MKIAFQKIAAVALGVGAAALASGCAVGEASDEEFGEQEAAFTYVNGGICATHIQIAAEIARVAMVDLGRFRPGLDLVKKNGKVVLTATGESRCVSRGGCHRLKSLLSYQYIDNMRAAALTPEFPFMKDFQASNISNALGSAISDYLNPNPNQVIAHELTFHHTSPAPPITNCGDLKYHCFSVSGLPTGKNVNDLVTSVKSVFSSNSDLNAMTRVLNENGYFCIDPDGTGDDQTGGGSTGGSTCVDGGMAMLYDASYVGNCCTLASGNGYLVQNMADPGYMSCKNVNHAGGKLATASSSLSNNPPSNTTDADENSLWKAATGNANESVKIDLGSSITVKGVLFKYEAAGAYGYKVETSANGAIWALKKTGTSAANATHQDANFAATSARYLRVTLTSLPMGKSAALASVKAY